MAVLSVLERVAAFLSVLSPSTLLLTPLVPSPSEQGCQQSKAARKSKIAKAAKTDKAANPNAPLAPYRPGTALASGHGRAS